MCSNFYGIPSHASAKTLEGKWIGHFLGRPWCTICIRYPCFVSPEPIAIMQLMQFDCQNCNKDIKTGQYLIPLTTMRFTCFISTYCYLHLEIGLTGNKASVVVVVIVLPFFRITRSLWIWYFPFETGDSKKEKKRRRKRRRGRKSMKFVSLILMRYKRHYQYGFQFQWMSSSGKRRERMEIKIILSNCKKRGKLGDISIHGNYYEEDESNIPAKRK